MSQRELPSANTPTGLLLTWCGDLRVTHSARLRSNSHRMVGQLQAHRGGGCAASVRTPEATLRAASMLCRAHPFKTSG